MLENYEDVLTVEDMCKILHVGKNTAYQLLQDNIISSRKIRRKYIIPKQSIINYLLQI